MQPYEPLLPFPPSLSPSLNLHQIRLADIPGSEFWWLALQARIWRSGLIDHLERAKELYNSPRIHDILANLIRIRFAILPNSVGPSDPRTLTWL